MGAIKRCAIKKDHLKRNENKRVLKKKYTDPNYNKRGVKMEVHTGTKGTEGNTRTETSKAQLNKLREARGEEP